MDRSISTPIKDRLFGTTWKSEVSEIINYKNNFTSIKNIEICLPFVVYKRRYATKLEFLYIKEKKEHTLLFRSPPSEIFYMSLFLREGHNKKTFGLELKADVNVIPQLITRKHWYYYEWDRKQLTIKRILGTNDSDKIEKMAIELLDEFKRFYYMYCKIPT
jgi:hypothetical protein